VTTPALLDHERQFLGCLLHLPAPPARRLAAGLDPGDFADPPHGWVFELITGVLAAGRAPCPVAVLDHARDHTDLTPRSGGAQRLAHLGIWLVDTYHDCAHPSEPYAAWLKELVLKHAWRRAITAHAHRVLQATEHATTSELRRVHSDTGRIEELWRRYQRAGGEGERPDGLGVVA
jgi:replicative DNA helicase